jgi:hypothetical protein
MAAGPGYWMDETGGELVPAVKRYLQGYRLSSRDIALIAAYLRQWIESPVWDQNPHMSEEGRAELARLRELARVLLNQPTIDAWLSLAVEFGVDPL